MRYLTLPEVLQLHRRVIEQSGGAAGELTREELLEWVTSNLRRLPI